MKTRKKGTLEKRKLANAGMQDNQKSFVGAFLKPVMEADDRLTHSGHSISLFRKVDNSYSINLFSVHFNRDNDGVIDNYELYDNYFGYLRLPQERKFVIDIGDAVRILTDFESVILQGLRDIEKKWGPMFKKLDIEETQNGALEEMIATAYKELTHFEREDRGIHTVDHTRYEPGGILNIEYTHSEDVRRESRPGTGVGEEVVYDEKWTIKSAFVGWNNEAEEDVTSEVQEYFDNQF